jgi:hypothetical protein
MVDAKEGKKQDVRDGLSKEVGERQGGELDGRETLHSEFYTCGRVDLQGITHV